MFESVSSKDVDTQLDQLLNFDNLLFQMYTIYLRLAFMEVLKKLDSVCKDKTPDTS